MRRVSVLIDENTYILSVVKTKETSAAEKNV
jgi:hypothetical protein